MEDIENKTSKKGGVVSVRLNPEISEQFDTVCKLFKLGKADFLRECIEKLCDENDLLTQNYKKNKEYIEFIRKSLSKLPKNKIEIENGSWENAKDMAIITLCDEIWSSSKKVWDCWNEICSDYIFYDVDGDEVKEFVIRRTLFDLGDIGLLLAGSKTSIDISYLLGEGDWGDTIELKKVSLLLAVKKAIEKYTAKEVINDALNGASKECGSPLRLVVDAKGEFKRSGDSLVSPVGFEEGAGET